MQSHLSQTLFILNLSSGRKKSSPLLHELVKRRINYYVSNSAIEFEGFINQETQKYKTLVICGGDGTINSIINQTHHLNVTYAIYPGGSGNGLSRELGFKQDLDHLITSIEKGITQEVDLIKINEQYCINMSGIGFDAFVAYQFDKSKKRGLKTYIKETANALRKYEPIEVNALVDNKEIKGKYFMVNIANTRQFGNNAYIAPKAQFNDGLLELALIQKIPITNLPSFLYKLFTAKLKDSKYIEYLKAKKVSIETNAAFYHIDGEAYEYTNTLNIKIDKKVRFIKV